MKKLVFLITLLSTTFLFSQRASQTIAVNFDLLGTTVLQIIAVYDHDETNQVTYTQNDNGNGEVDFFGIGLVGDNCPGIGPRDHIIGCSNAHAIELMVITNEGAWTLRGRGSGDFVSVNNNIIPLGRLAWALNDGATFTPFTTIATDITSGNNTNGTQVNLDLRLTLDAQDVVDNGYTTNLIFEVF